MSRFFLLLFLTTSLALSCGEEDQADIDRDLILGYIDNNNLQAEEDPSGLFYTIDAPGGEEKPQLTDSVEITYRGTLLSGLQFDASPADTTVTFLLDDLI
ncbi:MAG: peptidylprolyl isomerase, partial [Bacteroidota bacterium]